MWTWVVIGLTFLGMSGVIYFQHERIAVLKDQREVAKQETQIALHKLVDQQLAVQAMLDKQKTARQNALDSLKRAEVRVRGLEGEITRLRESKPATEGDCQDVQALVDSVW